MSDANDWISFAGGQLRFQAGSVARLQLNQPDKHNAMSLAMWEGLPETLAAVEADAAIRVVVVEGAGGKAFSAGADISEFAEVYATRDSTAHYNAVVREAQAQLRNVARPTIALVEGVCVGGGCGIALACDLRFVSSKARFGITPARLGVAYSRGDTAQLVEKVGPARAKDILFSGRLLEASEALAIGLVDRVYAPEDVRNQTLEYAASIAELSQTSILTAKTVINALTEPKEDDDAYLDRLVSSAFEGEDFREGYRAFLEKRKPKFR
jgi:enoyl-CoA hydratase/carnithine racemase